ncbi:gamma-glutamyl-gamma-aminobutyrate hydrolase family protein [Pseudomonas sp. DC3000-4b1]|uniref:gamma-glutamyl-gamma-aminobutyrate hydrolase family protein n=1 Tax=unclassified Pseudomonas TaxID=196821 RepID=UPI003CEA912A
MTMGVQERKGHLYQVMTHKYITPLVDIADCVPVLVPTCCGIEDLERYLDMADGVYLTGAGSNIDPSLYGQENLTPEKTQDPDRDNFDIPLIRAALDRGMPIFAICRGMQEINVALGGNIHQKLYTVPGVMDHRENPEDPVDKQYADSHGVALQAQSWLAEAVGRQDIQVNSLHGQGIDRLAEGLEVLGRAPDGTIEAFHAPAISPFMVGVQWHPEWQAMKNPVSIKLFEAFGDACRRFAKA